MNLERGFKYFLKTSTRFPETNLDLYAPRRLSTIQVTGLANIFEDIGNASSTKNIKNKNNFITQETTFNHISSESVDRCSNNFNKRLSTMIKQTCSINSIFAAPQLIQITV